MKTLFVSYLQIYAVVIMTFINGNFYISSCFGSKKAFQFTDALWF